MRIYKRIAFLIFIGSPALAVSPVISPSTPVVSQSGTMQFVETQSEAGTWTCSGTTSTGGVTGCAGSITSGGFYTAPSTVTPQHTFGGMQITPNNSVYNTRIDALPIHSSSTLYRNTVNQGGSPNWPTDFPINYLLPTGTTDLMNFTYSPGNNGTFEMPTFPTAKAEHGWYSCLQNLNDDHHVIMVDTVSATLSETYQYYPNCVTTAASVTNNVATLTCSRNPILNGGFVVGSTVVIGGFSGGDTYFNLASTTIASVTSTTISYNLTHANGTATTNGALGKAPSIDSTGLRNSQGGLKYNNMDYNLPPNLATDAAGMEIQPLLLNLQEFESAAASGGDINHAFRNTFALGYEASSSTWPATAFAVDGGTVPFGSRWRLSSGYNISGYSAKAQILLRALQRYGSFNVDGGNNWPMNAEETRWPKPYYDALTEVGNAVIASSVEFVNESGIMVSTSSALTTYNREIVTFTRTSDNAVASVDVALQGPAVNFQKDIYYFIAGAPATQLAVLNNFGGFTCSMNPSTGTLTSGCLYTPPLTVNVTTTTTVTATSSSNSAVTGVTTVTIYPSTGIYAIPSQTVDYTDTLGHVWTNRSGISNGPDTQGCCSCDSQASFSGTDVTLFKCQVGSASGLPNDTQMDFYVQNGTYKVTYNYGTEDATGGQFIKYSLGSTEIYSNSDPTALAGGQFKNWSTTSTVVTNNFLQAHIWSMNDGGSPVSSLSVVLVSSSSAAAAVASPSELWNGSSQIGGGVKLQ